MEHLNVEVTYPEDFEWYWYWFWDMRSMKSAGFTGPQRLTSEDMLGWSKMTGCLLIREEYLLLKDMDEAYINALSLELDAQEERRKALANKDD